MTVQNDTGTNLIQISISITNSPLSYAPTTTGELSHSSTYFFYFSPLRNLPI